MRVLLLSLLAVSILLGSGCATYSTHETLSNKEKPLVDIIPLRHFVANPATNYHYKVSPDGLKVAWIAVQGTHTKIHWRFIDSEEVNILQGSYGSDIYAFNWAQDSETFLSHGSVNRGSELTHIISLSIHYPQRSFVDVTPFKNTKVSLLKILKNDPEHIFVLANYTNKQEYDLYKINIYTKEFELIEKNTGNVTQWYIDNNGNVRARLQVFNDNVERLERYDALTKKWHLVDEWPSNDVFKIVSFSGAETAWVLSNSQYDKTALFRLNLLSGKRTYVYGEDNVDLDYVFIGQQSSQPLFALSMPDYPKIHFFDETTKQEFDALQNKVKGYLQVTSSDNSEKNIIVSSMSEKHVKHYLYQREEQALQLLGSHPLSQYSHQLSTTKAIAYKSRDGLIINGYLTIPNGFEGRKLPMLLKVHGGPWARDRYGLNSDTQFLANRGYAVLQLNFRGSTGYGKQFDLAGVGEFAQKMHTDLIDGVNWAVEKGIADKDKICIYGRSYGGYSVLVGLSQTPNVFACGIDIAGPTDLVSLVEQSPSYWKNYLSKWHQYVGNPAIPEQREQMILRSPLNKADKITKPLLIVHGARDPRVKLEQATKMVEALRKNNKKVEYLVFKDEGHSITKWTNNLTLYRTLEDFLAKHLGGRSNGYDFYELGKILY